MSASELLKVEHDETDTEARDERDRELDDRVDPENQRLRKEMATLQASVDKIGNNVDARLAAMETHLKLTTDPPRTPDVDTADPTPSKDLDAKKDALKKANAEAGKSTERDTGWGAGAYLGLFGAIAVVGGIVFVIVDYLSKVANKRPAATPLDPATKAQLDTLLANWKNLSDEAFWNKLADYVADPKTTLSIGDQLVFMKLTVMLGGLSGGFLWDSAQDESNIVDQLIKSYNDNAKSAAAMYRSAAKTTYQDKPIPRVVMAEVLQLAFAWIGVKASGSVKHDRR